MDKLQNLIAAFRDTGIRSVTLGKGYVMLATDTNDQLALFAKSFAATPVSKTNGNRHWQSFESRLDGMQVFVDGPESVMAGTERAS